MFGVEMLLFCFGLELKKQKLGEFDQRKRFAKETIDHHWEKAIRVLNGSLVEMLTSQTRTM